MKLWLFPGRARLSLPQFGIKNVIFPSHGKLYYIVFFRLCGVQIRYPYLLLWEVFWRPLSGFLKAYSGLTAFVNLHFMVLFWVLASRREKNSYACYFRESSLSRNDLKSLLSKYWSINEMRKHCSPNHLKGLRNTMRSSSTE